MRLLISLIIVLNVAACKQSDSNNSDKRLNTTNILSYIDPFIGTGFHGHTFPGPTRPNAMVQLSPDTHLLGWEASSGYHYPDSIIYGFSHTHLSGTGIGDLGDVLLIPYSGNEKKPTGKFSKENEKAEVGYYTVSFDNHPVKVELTTTKRVGFHKYTFEASAERKVLLDLSHILQANWGHKMIRNIFSVVSDKIINGTQYTSGWAKDHQISYTIEFSEPFIYTVESEEEIIEGSSFDESNPKVYLSFPPSEKPLYIKVALSPVDVDGANKNMNAELPHWDFDKVVDESKKEWSEALGVIQIETKDESVKKNFYTALYHTMISPFTYQDVDGRYRGLDLKAHQADDGFVNYTVFSLWDTFRAFHPLTTLTNPERASEWAESLVKKSDEGGLLPKWPLVSNYTGTMVGYPAVSVLADAASKGLIKGDIDKWLNSAVKASSWQPDFHNKYKGERAEAVMPKQIFFKEVNKFIPSDSIINSVSYGQEMAYYDWCVSKLAELAGNDSIKELYLEKAGFFKLYFDESTGLMRGKNADGSWRTPFNPRFSDHEDSDYVEGNAFQWSYLALHDVEGLIDLHGGKEQFETALDTLFTTSSEIEGERASADITGLIGQNAHGNEPSHHMPYLYNWTNSPHKAQKYLDQILYDFYSPTPEGIIGNEDCGQMSAWYILNAMGFYQVCPGKPEYSIGRPILDYASLRVEGGKFEVIVHNNSRDNKYVDKVSMNGKVLNTLTFTHEDLVKGGKLEFWMNDTP